MFSSYVDKLDEYAKDFIETKDSSKNSSNNEQENNSIVKLAENNHHVSQGQNKKENHSSSYTDSKLEVYFFNVGQADSIFLVTDNESMLVDTGNAGDAELDMDIKNKINISHEIKRLGFLKINKLVLTHAHEDHMGSAYKILKLFDVTDLYANPILPEDKQAKYYKKFVEALGESKTHLISPTSFTDEEIIKKIEEYNASVSSNDEKVSFDRSDYIRAGDVFYLGNAKITVLAPIRNDYKDTNDTSIVLMVEFEDVKLLLTGDAGKASERDIIKWAKNNNFDLKANILKVAHHGSRTANTEEFISEVQPRYSIIMVEEGNSYGLPDEDVIERLLNHGSIVYQTMNEGDIQLTIDDGSYTFDTSFNYEHK